MSNPDDLVDFIVVLDDGADPVAMERALGGAGLTSIRRLHAIGMILGRAAAGQADALRSVPGVRSVEREHNVSI